MVLIAGVVNFTGVSQYGYLAVKVTWRPSLHGPSRGPKLQCCSTAQDPGAASNYVHTEARRVCIHIYIYMYRRVCIDRYMLYITCVDTCIYIYRTYFGLSGASGSFADPYDDTE